MSNPTYSVETEALSLPEQQRTALVLKLLDSLERRELEESEKIENAWLKEANRRYEAYLSGEEKAIPAEEVFAELRAEDN